MSLGQRKTTHEFNIRIECKLTISPRFRLLITVKTLEALLAVNQAETFDWHDVEETEGRYSVGISFDVEYAYNSLLKIDDQIKLLEHSYLSLHVRQNFEENNIDPSIDVPFICDYNAYGANGDTLLHSKDGPVLIPYDEDEVIKWHFSWYVTPFLPSGASNDILCDLGRSSYV